MATLDTKDRNRLGDSSFAWIDKQGERHLPIHDAAHVRNAIARFNQTEFDENGARSAAAKKILRAAQRHGIEIDDGDAVARAARRWTDGDHRLRRRPRSRRGRRAARFPTDAADVAARARRRPSRVGRRRS